MNCHLRHLLLVCVISWSSIPCVAHAQELDPLFGQVPEAAPAQPAAVPPAAPAAAAAAPAEAAAPVDPFGGARPQESAAVRAALEWPRTNPLHAFRAVVVLVDLRRPELARPILEELHARGLDDATLAAIIEEFGSHRMLQISRIETLAPVGREFADRSMGAAAAVATNPQRLAMLVAELADPAPEVRLAAGVDLAATGPAGAKAALEAIGRETDPQRRGMMLGAVARLRPLVDGPLLAMLETNDPALRRDVAGALAQMYVPQAVPLLVAADAAGAERMVLAALDDYRQGRPPFAADAENQIILWHWNDAAKSLVSVRYPADEARVIWMSRLAVKLAELRPDLRPYRQQAVLLVGEASGLMTLPGLGASAVQPAIAPVLVRWEALDTPLVSAVLADALAANYTRAAVGAIDELGRRGDRAVLATADAQPSPLAAALAHGSRRVRFAALRAIVALDPPSAFPGSSRLAETLAYFARGAGRRDGIVAMPTLESAADVAGKLSAADVHGEATYFGSDVAKLAEQLSDLEMVLVDMDIQRPHVRQVLYELRITPASSSVPVALLAADGRLDAAHRLADEHERMIAVPRPHSNEAVAKIAGRLWELSQRDAATPEELAMQAVEAVTWTAQLLARGRTFYALRREGPAIETALYQPASSAAAVAALARFGTPSSQRSLTNFASHRTLPIKARRQAAAAFAASVAANGVLLTKDEIVSQYAIYNASATADADTQQVLGALLDAIESRRTPPVTADSKP
jgi:hypothetical protein